MQVIEPGKDEVAFSLTLKQFSDGTCGIESKSENGNGMKLVDVRQLLQWGMNRVQDEIVMNAVKGILAVQSAGLVLPNGK